MSSLVTRRTLQAALGVVAVSCLALAASAQTPPTKRAPTPSSTTAPSGAPTTFTVDIRMKGLHGTRGLVRGGIYNGTAHWPEADGSIANCAVPVRGREATCTFSIPPRPGVYAAAFFHDEDSDREFDTGFLGIPLEGYAFSRDAHAALSAPSFASAAFRVPLRTPVSATMRY